MNNLVSHLDQVRRYATRPDSLSSKPAVSLITTLKGFWHHDAIIAIAGLALVISFFSLLASKRANTIAARAQAEHGKIKDLRIEFCGLHFGGRKGSVAWASSPVPEAESSHTTKIAVYGGPDPLRIEQLMLRVTYTAGKLLCTRLILTLALNDSDLRVTGPDIPATIDAYHKVVWQLPELVIPSGVFKNDARRLGLSPGIYIPTLFESLDFHLVADYGGRSFVGRVYHYGMMFFPIVREARPIRTMSRFMADPNVPGHLKSLFEQWHLASVDQVPPRASPKAGSPKRRPRRRRR